jgi:dTDP-4-dehydrorhamnose reductase
LNGTKIILDGGRISKIKNILILGSNGQLGSILSLELARLNYKVTAFSKDSLNITNSEAVYLNMSQLKPDFVVNCAGWTNVNLAEKFPAEANLVNAGSLISITRACLDLGIKLIHISTDHVFSGKQLLPYAVNSTRAPVNKYGESKLGGEIIIEKSLLNNYWILRTSWLYGNSKNDFISKILKKYRENQEPIPVVYDQIGHPTFVKDLVKKIIELIDIEPEFGTYHASNSGKTSWFNFAQESVRLLGLDTNRLVPIKYSQLKLPLKRPANVELDFSKWDKVGLIQMRNWDLALNECMSGGGLYVRY